MNQYNKTNPSDIVHQEFNRLIVDSIYNQNVSELRQVVYKCFCKCGNPEPVYKTRRQLQDGSKDELSCGCIKQERYETDILYNKYGRLKVIKYDRKDPEKYRGMYESHYYWCECRYHPENDEEEPHAIISVRRYDLINHKVKSCGCLNCTHKDIDPIFINKHKKMKERCNAKPGSSDYQYYGARGITYDPKWESLNGFKDDMYEDFLIAKKLYGKNNVTLERKNNNLGYSKNNCIWAPWSTQQNNKSTSVFYKYKGNEYTVPQLNVNFADIGISNATLRYRINQEKNRDGNEIINDEVFSRSYGSGQLEKERQAKLNSESSPNDKNLTCPIRFIEDNNTRYLAMKLPTNFF